MCIDVLGPIIVHLILGECYERLIISKQWYGGEVVMKSFLSLMSHIPSADAMGLATSSASIDD